jgi:indolepyruvate ferredoxin oxidoreductase
MTTARLVRSAVTLEDKYTAQTKQILINGIQALVRLTLEQRWLDQRHSRNTAVFVSGYEGSPLGGVDRELHRARQHLEPAGVVFRTRCQRGARCDCRGGTQLLGQLGGARVDGVTGFWYGKDPGFDRAADAIRHATRSGGAPRRRGRVDRR